MNKRILILSICLLCCLGASLYADTDFFFYGDDRPALPGLELLNSIYAVNPAKTAEAVHNSISFASILLPTYLNTGFDPFGRFYSLTIPNFSLVNITQTSRIITDPETASYLDMTKELLGLQFGLSLDDFFNVSAFKLASGFSLYKFRDIGLPPADSLAESLNLDVGLTMSLYGFSLEALVKNLVTIKDEGPLFSDWDLAVRVGSKVILDVDFILGLATGNNYDLFDTDADTEAIVELNFIRYFLSNSLRTGVGLEGFLDTDAAETLIPAVRYRIAVCYTPFNYMASTHNPRELGKSQGPAGRSLLLINRFLQNLTFSFGTTIVVSSIPGNRHMVPVVSLGVTKFY